jgi:cytochrome c-type biogenesis protein CcmH/NrfG
LRAALQETRQTYWAGQAEIQQRVVVAWLARAEGKTQEALDHMRAAADLEDTTEKHPVTPGALVPARELLGEMLLECNDPAHALQAFEASHRLEPNRFQGLYGAARAARAAGARDKARLWYTQLVTLAAQADSERPELTEARAFLAQR